MILNTKFIIVGGDNDDADDEKLLIIGSDKNVDAFTTIFTKQLTKKSRMPAIYSIQSTIMANTPITNRNLLSFLKIVSL